MEIRKCKSEAEYKFDLDGSCWGWFFYGLFWIFLYVITFGIAIPFSFFFISRDFLRSVTIKKKETFFEFENK